MQLSGLRDEFSWWEPVEIAVWWHDAIYDPARSDNEARSAALMRDDLQGLADQRLIDRAATLIEATAHHAVRDGLEPDVARDMALFLDVDMGILGAPAAAFAAYEAGIAAEYVPVHGIEKYRAGRAMVLTSFLARDRLYLSDHFHGLLEEHARANLAGLIATLTPPTPALD
ncbi:hypothetical protein [Niveispirillum sp. KHB5.9]|uniref:HD domain-containing protein n=1 Tax=Niveispirillum sp. KHB5.9 TaxID=3400269 RepID=UPI003A8B3805